MDTARSIVIVVDTNVVCYRWIPGSRSPEVDKALLKDADWIVPLLWRSEFRNAMAGSIRKKLITIDVACEIIDTAESHFINREFAVSSHSVLDLVVNSTCSAYDCEFIALARANGVRLLTVDQQILNEFPDVAVSLRTFVRD